MLHRASLSPPTAVDVRRKFRDSGLFIGDPEIAHRMEAAVVFPLRT